MKTTTKNGDRKMAGAILWAGAAMVAVTLGCPWVGAWFGINAGILAVRAMI